MRPMVLNVAAGVVWAACLSAAHPVVAEDLSQDEALVSPNAVPNDLKDTALANNPRRSEYSGSVATNPKDPKILVASVASCGASACRSVLYRSDDAGRTWSQPAAYPGGAIAYAPNGNRLYAAYANSDGLVVGSSDDNGATWSPPAVALPSSEGESFSSSSIRIATPVDERESRWVYVAAVRGYKYPDCDDPGCYSADFLFIRSADFGATWSPPEYLGYWDYMDQDGITGGAVAGGQAGEVLVAGPGVDEFYNWGVLVARSQNHGGSFAVTVAAADADAYRSVDVKIGHKEAAHVVYDAFEWSDPNSDPDIDIKYIWSPGPPYTTWSEPVTVNDDGAQRRQLNPSIATQTCGASTVLHLVWEDARLRPKADCYNSGWADDCHWDVFYARKIAKSGASWSKNVRVSGKSSLTGVDMSPHVAASQGRAVAVWTDRRDKTDPYDEETDAYASGILSGATCP